MKYTTIVSTQTLEDNLHQPDWVVFDFRPSVGDYDTGLKAYNKGHIPKAVYCHLEQDFSSAITETSGRHPLPDFAQLIKKLGHWGVNKKTQVVIHDDDNGAYAVRLWWQLRTLGHKNVAILDGGIKHWMNENRAITTKTHQPIKTTFSGKFDPQSVVTTTQIEQNIKQNNFTLLDARAAPRYRGEQEPLDPVAGRIPGAVNRAFQLNLDENGLFLSPAELKLQFASLLIDKDKPLVHMCGSGITACHNMLAMEIAGFSETKLYLGSWSEWIRDSNRPLAKG